MIQPTSFSPKIRQRHKERGRAWLRFSSQYHSLGGLILREESLMIPRFHLRDFTRGFPWLAKSGNQNPPMSRVGVAEEADGIPASEGLVRDMEMSINLNETPCEITFVKEPPPFWLHVRCWEGTCSPSVWERTQPSGHLT